MGDDHTQFSESKDKANDEKSYLYRINSDFDRKKYYEETVLKIMNEMSVSKITEPRECELFGERFPNNTNHKRTIFLDLDDTLIYVSILKIDTDKLTHY